jgi:Mg2+ and Co2+ transporter CorA
MSISRSAGSQAGWALITGGVSSARVQAHRLHQLLTKIMKLVDSSPAKEHLYQVAGDIIMAFPKALEDLEQQLDETNYALSMMGTDHLKERLPITRRNKVEETIEGAPAFGAPMLRQTAKRVAERHMAKRVAQRHLGRK